MINHLVVLGATGDLSARYLLAALAALRAAGHIDDRFRMTGASREDWSSEQFQHWAATQLDLHGISLPAEVRTAFAASLDYRRTDVSDSEDVAAVVSGDAPLAIYLGLPRALFPTVVRSLHRAGLPSGSQIVLEKPFGEDLAGVVELSCSPISYQSVRCSGWTTSWR